MALQQINWLQIDTTNVPSGSIVDLGAISSSLHAVYADNLYVSGQTIADIIAGSGTDALNAFTSSLNQAIELTGSNLTVKGNLLVKGTTTAINSTTVAIGDNIIELNGSAATNGGLLIKDPTAPNTISGSLLWDSTNDYWKAGQLGSEEKIVLISQLNSATSSLSASITNLSSSVSNSLHNLRVDLDASNIWQKTGSYYNTTNDLQVTGSLTIKGNLNVEGITTLVQKLDPNVESLVVSGAMSVVQNQINNQVIKASLTIQNLGTLADRGINAVIDCGDSFF
jgi:phage baseplate assembly protein gpV